MERVVEREAKESGTARRVVDLVGADYCCAFKSPVGDSMERQRQRPPPTAPSFGLSTI